MKSYHEQSLPQRLAEKKERTRERAQLIDPEPMNYITNVVCDVLGMKVNRVKSPKQYRELVVARQTIMSFARMRGIQLWYIAWHLGEYDHSTVSHGIKTVKETLLLDKFYKTKYDKIKSILNKDYLVEQEKTIDDLSHWQ